MSKSVKIGTPAPEFRLKDFLGYEMKLSDFRGEKNVVLVLNRGFIWPYCRKHMAQLRLDYNKFLERNAEVIVIGPDSAEDFKQYWQEHDLPFIGLPDPRHKVLKLYGQEIKILKFGRMPAQVLIDEDGIVREIHYGRSMSDIPTNEELLSLLDNLNHDDDSLIEIEWIMANHPFQI